VHPKCKNGIRDRGLKQQLRLRSKGNVNEILRQNIVLEVVKLSARSSIRIPKMCIKILWRSQPPRKQEGTTESWSARDVELPATLGSFACTGQKGRNDSKPVDYSGQAALKREQQYM
jgi:hypothetical protein